MADDDDFNDPIDDEVEDFDDDGAVEDFGDESSTDEIKKDTKNESIAASSSSLSPPSRGASYRVLDESSLDDRLRRFLSEMTALLDMPTGEISVLLRSHQWNKERLMAAYSDKPTETLAAAGLESYDENNTDWKNLSVSSIDCSICDDTVPKEKAFALPCKHAFCNDCWRSYLNDKMANGRSVISTRCPYYQCTTAIPDSVFQQFLDSSSYSRYHRYILRSFVEDNKSMRWCPAPQCSHAIEAIDRTITTVTCACKHIFCFQCGSEESHRPITCQQLARWKEKCGSESETAQWMLANTRKCPKCHVRIEKNSGCNHMTCRANGCKYEFCWVCNGPWSDHGSETGGFYKCNKFSAKAALARGDATSVLSEDERQQETNRYLFYYQRYHNHEQSKKFAERQREATERRMNELHSAKSDMLWIDVKYLAEATHAVFQCRQVLKYTYVFAYYLPEGREKTLFEFLQQKLEQATEKLSELSELPIESQDKLQITNYMRVTLQFMNNLLDGVANGLTS